MKGRQKTIIISLVNGKNIITTRRPAFDCAKGYHGILENHVQPGSDYLGFHYLIECFALTVLAV